jgi:hypothetical protein
MGEKPGIGSRVRGGMPRDEHKALNVDAAAIAGIRHATASCAA